MPHVVRTSITIGGSRLSDTEFTHVNLRQNVGEHHDFEIRLRQNANRGVLAEKGKKWIGQPIALGFDILPDKLLARLPVPVTFKGIINSVALARRSGTAEMVVRGKSPTLATEDGPNTRSFTDKTLLEIVDEVLKPYEGFFPEPSTIEPKRFSGTIPYAVQYMESNFGFITRLANRYGEWFYYDGLKFYFGKPEDKDAPIKLDFGSTSLIDFDIAIEALPANFEMQAYDYTKHETTTEKSPLSSTTSELGKEVLDIATGQIFPIASKTTLNVDLNKDDLKNLVQRREEVVIDEMVIMNGSSRNPKLKIGATIEVTDKELGENYGSFVVTNLIHRIGQGGDYVNSFKAIPVEVKTAPLSSMPSPPFCETQLAKVTDVNDDKKLGRVRVKFPWQEGTEEKSPWIRVASPYTGKDKGFYIIPEEEDQVLVSFENNHPDKPYVLTGMYNGDASPEWFEPKNRFKGFKSKGKNQWKFDDKSKTILIHAPNAITMSAGNKITINTGGKEDSEIMVNAGEGTINVVAKTINVVASENINMTADKEINATGKETVNIKGETKEVTVQSVDVKVDGTKKVDVKGTLVDVTGSGPVTVKGALIKLNS